MSADLKSLYIEPTSHCNLNCIMCSRNHWKNESIGHMDVKLFDKFIKELPESVERIVFAGIGEPLCHPEIIHMLEASAGTGRRIEIITNGTLLDTRISKELVRLKIDTIWISVDSMDEESYEKIRIGSQYSNVLENIKNFNKYRIISNFPFSDFYDVSDDKSHRINLLNEESVVKLGICLVLMKSNIGQLGKIVNNAFKYNINEIKTTHLLPFSKEQEKQICYDHILQADLFAPSRFVTNIDMVHMETIDMINGQIPEIFNTPYATFSIMGNPLNRKENYCKFIKEGQMFIRWDGEVSPCMALLHDNTVYQQGDARHIIHCSFGNANEKSITELWNEKEYFEFRKRVDEFTFANCNKCGHCDLFETNEDDCFGNKFPTCGSCLWAHGFIQCP